MAAILVVALGLANWRQISENTDWGVLYLFGGGLTLSAVLRASGASAVLGQQVAALIGGVSPFVMYLIVAVFIVFLTEFTSNTASAALLVPVFAAIAEQMGLPPKILVLMIGIGASLAFMMPVATPPNAIVFATGHIRQRGLGPGLELTVKRGRRRGQVIGQRHARRVAVMHRARGQKDHPPDTAILCRVKQPQ